MNKSKLGVEIGGGGHCLIERENMQQTLRVMSVERRVRPVLHLKNTPPPLLAKQESGKKVKWEGIYSNKPDCSAGKELLNYIKPSQSHGFCDSQFEGKTSCKLFSPIPQGHAL